ncbi:MAG: phage major capsid protein [Epsilonproteobacteria bacterium]|nr:MAG: phage major capsid protein [Campylobacterota bacterium]
MAATSRTLSYDHLLTTTADKIHKSGAIQNAITSSNPTFAELMTKGRIKKKTVGGDQIRVGLMYQHNGTISSYSDYDQIDVTPQDGITTMYVPWAQYGGAVSISGIQKFKNMGKEAIADLLKEKITQTTAGWSEKLNADLWDIAGRQATHPYSGNGGKNVIGFPIYIQDAAEVAGDVYDIGHIDQSVETWWNNKTGTPSVDTYFALQAAMRSMYNNCSQGPGGKPDLVMADQVSYEIYETGMDDQIRYSFKDKASVGFENIAFKGAKMMWDGYVPDAGTPGNGALATGSALAEGSMYFINTKTMTLYVGKDHDWKPRGFQTPVDQDASTSLYLAYLQLVCDNRRKNGVIQDIEPTIVS